MLGIRLRVAQFVALIAGAMSPMVALANQSPTAPATVSPGGLDRTRPIADRCPTMSWAEIGGGRGYEIAVFALREGAAADPAEPPTFTARVDAAASSWTPSLDECLEPGRYAWVVRAETAGGPSAWSAPRFFEVREPAESPEVRRAARALLEEWLAAERRSSAGQARATAPAGSPHRDPEMRRTAGEVIFVPELCKAGEEVFADVPATSPDCAWIERLYRDGVTAGCGGGKFCPSSPVTRAQMARLLEKAMQRRGVREIDSGDYNVCALTAAGRTVCWGRDYQGSATPPGVVFNTISAGLDYGCGVNEIGQVQCWGENRSGRTTPPQTAYVSVSAGAFHVCGIELGGEVSCWGESEGGRLGVPQATFRSISAGNAHTCGVTTDGGVACWGYNNFGQTAAPPGLFTEVTSGGAHTCGLRPDHTVACWGWNDSGQATPPPGTFSTISAGAVHTCGVKTDGLIACWGSAADGRSNPPWGSYVGVTAGSLHTCALTVDGAVVCWGWNAGGATNAPPWL